MINVTINNGDLRDLFVTVLDLNQAGGVVILNGKRFNRGDSALVYVQDDGDGLGHIRWQVNVADEPSTTANDDVTKLSEGDTVSVHT